MWSEFGTRPFDRCLINRFVRCLTGKNFILYSLSQEDL